MSTPKKAGLGLVILTLIASVMLSVTALTVSSYIGYELYNLEPVLVMVPTAPVAPPITALAATPTVTPSATQVANRGPNGRIASRIAANRRGQR